MPRLLAATVCSALVAAGCGEPEGTGRLEVHKMLSGAPSFMEGSLTEITLRDGDGRSVLRATQGEPGAQPIVARALPAGDYRLVAQERPCQGNCGMLDPPGPDCRVDVEVRAQRTVRVVVLLAGGAIECTAA